MIGFLKKIWSLLDKKEKFLFFLLLVMMCFGAYLELLGIGLVLPIIAVLTNPVLLQENKLLHFIYRLLSPSSDRQFMVIMCLLVSAVFFLKMVFFLVLTKVQAKFSYDKCQKMERELFSAYVSAPYLYHLNKNSAEIFSNFNQMKGPFVAFLTSVMLLLTEFICVFFIFLSLFVFTPLATLVVLLMAAAGFGFIVLVVKRYGNTLGRQDYGKSLQANKLIMETFQNIKEVKLYCREEQFFRSFSAVIGSRKKVLEKIAILGQAPRFIIEFVMVLGAMGLLVAFVLFDVASASILLKLSLICIALIRLMPSFSRIQYNYTNAKILHQTFDSVLFDLFHTPEEGMQGEEKDFAFEKSIEVKNVSFSYLSGKEVLKNVSFSIEKNTSCGFIGKTGCGKTTLADILIGLIFPASGEICVDGRPVRENIRKWRSLIGYVPQQIQLFDDTIAANVAFGVEKSKVDQTKLRKCLEMAQAWDFVSSLEQGTETLIGENGIRLSGGQRQRLGIARALYHEPKFLVLDEATSALDNETEKAFMDAVGTLQGKLTMLIIAHRLSTIRKCDQIIDLSDGTAEKKDPAALKI
ncbi:MAG: ABC transporter ATP-binding protein [Lentisphaeria bacterium]|nr:ABC transporter ATP-binding protein [Lentisphaeria bacterium]